MKSVWLSLSLLLMLAGRSAAQAPQPPAGKAEAKVSGVLTGQPLKEDPKDDELQKLMKARYNEALAEMEGLFAMYKAARATYDEAAGARQRLLRAGLDLCDTPADKIALLTRFVEWSKAAEEIAKARFTSGRGAEAAVHRARYQRLDAEIHILRIKREAEKARGK